MTGKTRIAIAPSGPIYREDQSSKSSTSERIVTVVVFPAVGGVTTHVFDTIEHALECYDDLCQELPPDHKIQLWDTGYIIKEGAGRDV